MNLHLTPKERLIVALDVDNLAKTTTLVEALGAHVGLFKVGLELLTAVGAPQVVHHVHRLGGQLFVDGKFCDIPNTVGSASRALSSMGVKMFNVHASCGVEAMKAAVENKGSSILLAVTILTSIDDTTCSHIFGSPTSDKVMQLALDALEAGVDGIICAAQDLAVLNQNEALKKLQKITPGIRPSWSQDEDQKRTMTPAEAIKAGATMIVMGRPIINPPRGIGGPLDAIAKVTEEIAGALA